MEHLVKGTSSGGQWLDTSNSGGQWLDTSNSGGQWLDTSNSGGQWLDTADSGGQWLDTADSGGQWLDTAVTAVGYRHQPHGQTDLDVLPYLADVSEEYSVSVFRIDIWYRPTGRRKVKSWKCR
jgi:hypothetical protein